MSGRSTFILLCAGATAWAGCASGHGTGSPLPPVAPAPGVSAPAPGRTAGALRSVTIVVPKKQAATAARKPAYVSPDSQSIAVRVNGSPPIDANLTSPTCAAQANGDLDCTVSVPAPAGTDSFDIRLYSGLDETGTVLSRSTESEPISDATTQVTFTLNGVVATAKIMPIEIPAGIATTVPVMVQAADAAGDTIIGSDPYVDADGNPASFTIAYSDPSHNSTLAASASVNAPGQTAGTISYNGKTSFGGSLTGTGSSAARFAGASVVIDPNIVAAYPGPHLDDDVFPCIVVGSDGDLYYDHNFDDSQTESAIGRVDLGAGTFTEYKQPYSDLLTCLTEGPDGRVWAASDNLMVAFATTTTGSVSVYTQPSPAPDVAPSPGFQFITTSASNTLVGADGTGSRGNISTSGQFGPYVTASPAASCDTVIPLHPLTVDANGSMFEVCDLTGSGASIGITTPDGAFTSHAFPNASPPQPIDLQPDANGGMWATDDASPQLYKITTSGITTLPLLPDIGGAIGLTPGIAGDLWASSGGSSSTPGTYTHQGLIRVLAANDAVSYYNVQRPYGLSKTCTGFLTALTMAPDGTIYGVEKYGDPSCTFVKIVY